jgi:hypothetical protein
VPSKDKYPQGKRALFAYVSEDIYNKVHELALSQYNKFHGAVSAVVEEALRLYLAQKASQGGEGGIPAPRLHTHSTHKAHGSVYATFLEILNYIKRQYNYPEDERVCEIKEGDLVKAIHNTKGMDPRTVEKYLKLFETHKLIRYDRGTSPNVIFRVLIYPECKEE